MSCYKFMGKKFLSDMWKVLATSRRYFRFESWLFNCICASMNWWFCKTVWKDDGVHSKQTLLKYVRRVRCSVNDGGMERVHQAGGLGTIQIALQPNIFYSDQIVMFEGIGSRGKWYASRCSEWLYRKPSGCGLRAGSKWPSGTRPTWLQGCVRRASVLQWIFDVQHAAELGGEMPALCIEEGGDLQLARGDKVLPGNRKASTIVS